MIYSYSLLNDYKICRRRCFHKWIARDVPKEAPTPAMKMGTDFHEGMALRLDKAEPLPAAFKQHEPFAQEIEAFLEKDGHRWTLLVEQKMGITENGQPCDFFADDVWFRGVADVVLADRPCAWMGDWKTGNVWEDPTELRCHAMLLKAHMPELKSIAGNYIWLKAGRVGMPYDLSDTEKMFTNIREIVDDMLHNDMRVPSPGPLCKYCPVTRQQCMHRK